ncbi:MAG: tryptophan--tRNA ligase, partial [Tumebacillaceae bacterium]
DNTATYAESGPDTSALVASKVAIGLIWSNQLAAYQAAMTDKLGAIQARYNELGNDPAELDRILAAGAEKARVIAEKTVNRVKDAMGLVRL